MAGLAGFGQRLDRLVLGVGVVARDLVERDGQDDADHAGPGRAHVEPVGAEAGPERQAAVDQPAQGLWVLLVIFRAKLQVEEAQDHEAHDAENRAQDESVVDASGGPRRWCCRARP